jgi:hypothetical protein
MSSIKKILIPNVNKSKDSGCKKINRTSQKLNNQKKERKRPAKSSRNSQHQ